MMRKSKLIATALRGRRPPDPDRCRTVFKSRGNAQVVRASRNIYDFTPSATSMDMKPSSASTADIPS